MVIKRKLLWDNIAKQHLRELYAYIKKESPQNALAVRDDIISALTSAAELPERHPPDKYRINNTELAHRSFELHRYRISYFVEQHAITVTRLRHTSMEPAQY